MAATSSDVRFTPESRHWLSGSGCPLCARSGYSALQQKMFLFDHLIGNLLQVEWHKKPAGAQVLLHDHLIEQSA
jgi:hypothetical protein